MDPDKGDGPEGRSGAGAFHLEELGEGHPPLVLLHGFGASNFSWRLWAPALKERHRLLLVELKGFGRGSIQRSRGFGPDEQSRELQGALREWGVSNPVLVGHSFGGGVALMTALALQEAGAPATALVLVCPAIYPQRLPPFIAAARVPVMGELLFTLLPPTVLMTLALDRITHSSVQVSREQVHGYAEPLRSLRRRYAMIRAARELFPDDHPGLLRRIPSLRSPTLVVWGRQDPVIPWALGARLTEDLPDARLSTVEDCGHIPMEERPEESLAPVLQFLEGVAKAATD